MSWHSEDLTESAEYLPEFGAVRYSYPDRDMEGVPVFRSCLIGREAAVAILGLFPEGDA